LIALAKIGTSKRETRSDLQRSLFTFTEHESKSIQSDLGWEFNDSRLDQLEHLNAKNRDTLFYVGRKIIKASQYVGLVRLGNTTLQILPKVSYSGDFDKPEHSPEHQAAVQTAMRNLLVMLSVACDLPLRAQNSTQLHTDSGDWLEILTRLFALELHHQFQVGLPHAYVTIEERLPVIRGRWLVGQQISQHTQDWAHFNVSYDEFSPDTPLNRTFSLTVDTLRRLTQDSYNRRLLLDLHDWLSDCKPRREALQNDLSKVHFSRLDERFRPAFNLATLFWEQRLIQLSPGDLPSFAFVFDMNRLFQDFIAHFLQRHQKRILPTVWQDGEIVLQSQGEKVYLAERFDDGVLPGKSVFHLIPDILLTSPHGNPFLIADMKYKKISPKAADGGVAEGDAYQMLAYARRWNCPQALLIYPASNQTTGGFTLRAGLPDVVNIRVVELNLQQPLEKPDGLIEELRLAFQPD
jgi:5-methylcytosine-specific restriction enzyme subunit McrC